MALYHKHRPQDFSSIIGQEHIIKTITNQILTDKVAHAYLFSGPRGIGKTTTARLLAKALNCENRKEKEIEPCNKCSSCEEISSSRAIDVIEMDAASHTGVDNVRENIIDNAQFKPTKSKYKVFIIDEVHMLSTSAFNALLKTLEEPPSHVVFILATTEMHKLPETIISRCQRFDYKKIPFDTMKKHLNNVAKIEETKIDKDVVERIINKSDGCARDAISLLDQIMATGKKNITAEIASLVLPSTNVEKTLEFVGYLVEKEMKPALELINKLVDEGINLMQFSQDTIELLRIMMVSKANANIDGLGLDLNDKTKKELRKLNDDISHSALVELIDLVMKRRLEIKNAPIPQLPLELVVIEWCNLNTRHDTHNTKHLDNNIDNNDKFKKQENNDKQNTNERNDELNASEIRQTTDESTKQKIEKSKKTITQKVKSIVSKSNITREEVENHWNEFIKKIETNFPTLSFILKMSSILGVNGNNVQLSVGYSFHKDKLMEKTCKDNVEKLLTETLGSKAKLEIIVQEQSEKKEEKKEIQELASAFGGEIIT